MAEPFEAIGFQVTDEVSYQALAWEAYQRGTLTRIAREQGVLHGSCWSLGGGLEVWTILYESPQGTFYADCRPAFRTYQAYQFYPWEILEFEQDGEALLTGIARDSRHEWVIALQNLTELDLGRLPQNHITAVVSGLAYRARVIRPSRQGAQLTAGLSRRVAAENDYRVRGEILSWREISNPLTESHLLAFRLALGRDSLEVLVNRRDLTGTPMTGQWLSAEIWLQGYLLGEQQLRARYEGVDPQIPRHHFWRPLRSRNWPQGI
jgi:hypothetical protein